MGENSKIEWCDHTFNPVIGCTKISAGCDHCYAESMAKRYGWVEWGPHGERKRTSVANWQKPFQWARKARQTGARPRVFCASLADVFDNQWNLQDRADLFGVIEDTPELDWLLLTKRPENVADMIFPKWDSGLPKNVWMGVTCENQDAYNRRMPILQRIPARMRFISYEPAIGPLRLVLPHPTGIHWIICGGESGPGHRPMEMRWEADIRHDCKQVGISYFFKQLSGKRPVPADFPVVRQFPVAA